VIQRTTTSIAPTQHEITSRQRASHFRAPSPHFETFAFWPGVPYRRLLDGNATRGAGQSISSLWSQKSGKQQKARAARSQAQAIDAKADALHDRLESTQRSLQQANEYYSNYWRQMRRTEAQIVRTRHRLHLVTERYNRRRVLFGRRLAAMQRSGKLSYLQVFLGSNTMSDLTRRSQLYQTITARDAELQAGLREDKAELQHQQNYLASQWERAARRAYERRQAQRYARSRRDGSGYRRARYEREDAYNEDVGETQGHSEHFHGDGHNHSADGWSLPVRGRLSSRYGMRHHPILRRRKMHTGDDLAAPHGSPIKAAHSGRVLWAGWKKAYGNTVIIDDGKGTQTLYGHASKLSVRPGQPIRRGEYIGNVGSTGYSTGPHLHFEVRKKGKPVDPSRYMRSKR
jgi:murein DD-endopeptidase MepM/ murein hydrolase activator NlpD